MSVRDRERVNPYIALLKQFLPPAVDTRWFSWREALFGDYDVLHLHWPENLLAGHRRGMSRAASPLYDLLILALVARCRLRHTPVVRTLHNAYPHELPGAFDRLALRVVDKNTTWWILLNEVDTAPVADRTSVVLHGDYRRWFHVDDRASIPGRLAFVGMIRPYKNVPHLIRTFQEWAVTTPEDVSLVVAGQAKPTELADEVAQVVAQDSANAVDLSLGYVSDNELVSIVQDCEVVVLPYHQMGNSGAALLALSLDRPILVPRTPMTEDLREEVGGGWVTLFDGGLTTADLAEALRRARLGRNTPRPSLERRDWKPGGAAHWATYLKALDVVSARRRPKAAPRQRLEGLGAVPVGPDVAPGQPAVTVAIATYRRPEQLARMLPTVQQQVSELAPPGRVIVVDNDPDGSAEAVASVCGTDYVRESAPGIAAARNRALDECIGDDAIVFIDDDEIPTQGWLRRLIETWQRYNCAGVSGPTRPVFEGPVDDWLCGSGVFESGHRPTGTELNGAATNNLLLDLRVLQAVDLRFDEAYGTSGGSDSMLTRLLTQQGGSIRWCEEAVVVDRIPAARLTRRWVLQRSARTGNAWCRVQLDLCGSRPKRLAARLELTARAGHRFGRGLTRSMRARVRGEAALSARGSSDVATAVGMFQAICGVQRHEYKRSTAPA